MSRRLAVAVLAAVVAATLPAAVIVQARPGALAAAARQVQQFGGQVVRQLGIINGFTAPVPGAGHRRQDHQRSRPVL